MPRYSDRYLDGLLDSSNYHDLEVAPLDSWMQAMDGVANEWIRTILRAHRAEYKALCEK